MTQVYIMEKEYFCNTG